MMTMDKKALIEIIKQYKESPCLWDQTHSLYANKEARNQAYNELLDSFKHYQKDASMETMKKKFENMRTACRREYKKVMAAKIKGHDYRPTLWYYDLLSFIHNDADYDDNPLDCTEGEQIDESCDYNNYEEYEEDATKPKRLKITEVFVQNQSNIDDTTLKYTNDSTASRINDDEAVAFGRTVGLQLKELDNYQKIIAEKLISDTIFLARLNKLTNNSKIEYK
ncbi:unnamed protein product [Euphydryas editha]|uniref:MADF domain-containing protein n=1 Tax=Euphydryas editha TaxID=104508 RepID=A0AAU9TQ75_EUPED|nr:unnamed protein product [Euphydryas editha]